MAITVIGAKIKELNISVEEGKAKASGKYELMSSEGKVLAKQPFGGGYNEIAYTPSPATQKLLEEAFKGVADDLNTTMGLN
jgi:hypothetical protein